MLSSVDFTSIRVDALMSRAVLVLPVRSTLREAAAQLLEARVSAAPVVDAGGAPVGVLSLRDVVGAMNTSATLKSDEEAESPFYIGLDWSPLDFAPALDDPRLSGAVADYMSATVMVCKVGDPIASACVTMFTRRVHRLLVVDEGRLVGILSALDIVGYVGGCK